MEKDVVSPPCKPAETDVFAWLFLATQAAFLGVANLAVAFPSSLLGTFVLAHPRGVWFSFVAAQGVAGSLSPRFSPLVNPLMWILMVGPCLVCAILLDLVHLPGF